MRIIGLVGLASLLMTGACAVVPAGSVQAQSLFMPIGAPVDAPKGYSDMCSSMRSSLCQTEQLLVARNTQQRAPAALRLEASSPAVAAGRPNGAAVLVRTIFKRDINSSPEPAAIQLAANWTEPKGLLLGTTFGSDSTSASDLPVGEVLTVTPVKLQPGSTDTQENTEASTGALTSSPVLEPVKTEDGSQAGAPQQSIDVVADRLQSFKHRLSQLEAVNRRVNANVIQRTDLQNYGVAEFWTRAGAGPGASGDCEDMAIEKRWELIDQGYPEEDLFYAVAYREDIGLHVVLVAHTERGDLILDSRSPYITSWQRAPYIWIKRQRPGDGMHWALIDAGSARPVQQPQMIASLDPQAAAKAAEPTGALARR